MLNCLIILLIAFVRKHYIPEGGQNISTAEFDTNLRMTPFMYIYISLGSKIGWSRIVESRFQGSKLYDLYHLHFFINSLANWYVCMICSSKSEYAIGIVLLILVFFLVNFLKYFLHPILTIWTQAPLSQLLIDLQSSSKNENDPHGLHIWDGDTFQSSSYHSFPLKPGCVRKSHPLNKDPVSLS